MVFIMKAQPPLKTSKGFALIATISVLMLLTMIAVAFLSLSAVSLKTARIDMAQEEANSNARLALMIALGELQREMGPDQRVSVAATILDATPESLEVSKSDVDQQHWLGVWSANWSESSGGAGEGSDAPEDQTPWLRDDSAGGLVDRRYTPSLWEPEDNVRTWLVSGNEGGQDSVRASGRDFLEPKEGEKEFEENRIELVATGSVLADEDMVTVKAVGLQRFVRGPSGVSENKTLGRYGYWVSSNSAKANLGVINKHIEEEPSPSSESGYEGVFHAQSLDPSAITGVGKISTADAERIISPATLRLASSASADEMKEIFHDITTQSRSVLSNTRDGGLKKDLSVYLAENSDIADLDGSRLEYVGLSGTDNLVGSPNQRIANLTGARNGRYELSSPKFGIIKSWLEDAKSKNFSLEGTELDISSDRDLLPELAEYRKDASWDVYDRLLSDNSSSINRAPVHSELSETSFKPVVVEASLYYNLATRRSGQFDGRERWVDYICLYPRVALWNPYSVPMTVPPMIIQMFVNGNKEVRVTYEDGKQERMYLGFGAGNHGGNGNNFFLLAGDGRNPSSNLVTIPAGETVVYTIDISKSKRGGNLQRDYSKTDYMNNLMTPYDNDISPDNYLLVDKIIDVGNPSGPLGAFYGVDCRWSSVVRENDQNRPNIANSEVNVAKPISFREDPGGGRRSGGDNYQFALFDASGQSRANHGWHHGNPGSNDRDGNLHEFPMISMGSISLQAGGRDELPLRWPSGSSHPVYVVGRKGGTLQRAGTDGSPSELTRDGFRLRWYEEHASNLQNSPKLGGQTEQLFQTAGIGNWNVRSAYNIRNPWDNVTEQPPYFFGNYTRDQLDFEVGWESMRPKLSGGLQTGFPFGPPNSDYNQGPVVLFELPTDEIGIPNLAYLRHLQLSEYAWHPTYAIGNSLADPRCKPENSAPDLSESPFTTLGGWNGQTMGDTNGGRNGKPYWSGLNKELIGFIPDTDSVVYDMSFETNYNIWDTYMLAVGGADESERSKKILNFADDPVENPLPNGRLGLFTRNDLETDIVDDLGDFYRAAARLSIEGGFDVNSTSVESWKALLSATKEITLKDSKDAVFPRFLNPPGDTSGNDGLTQESLSGNRELDEDEIELLAEQIVVQVKKRAPFFGLADFVNRRLASGDNNLDISRAGAIEAALQESGVNSEMETPGLAITERDEDLKDISFDSMTDSTRLDHRLKPSSQAWGLPGYLTQGDVLGVLGSTLSARSDTFTIRTYGESRDINGKILARAWCEATVQRTPEPVVPDKYDINPEPPTGDQVDFGRRFKIIGFRWMTPQEI